MVINPVFLKSRGSGRDEDSKYTIPVPRKDNRNVRIKRLFQINGPYNEEKWVLTWGGTYKAATKQTTLEV